MVDQRTAAEGLAIRGFPDRCRRIVPVVQIFGQGMAPADMTVHGQGAGRELVIQMVALTIMQQSVGIIHKAPRRTEVQPRAQMRQSVADDAGRGTDQWQGHGIS